MTQNPDPNPSNEGQQYQQDKTNLVQDIMTAFRSVLPSNYVATTNGPWYSLQFQAMAEQLADIQLEGGGIYKDSGWDFTRPDFLWQVLGALVFPEGGKTTGIPRIDGDVPYRTFLRSMVDMLLLGATKASLEGGLEAADPLVAANITEKYLQSPPRDSTGAYTIVDQFTIDVKVETASGTEFPADPIIYQDNANLVLAALKPAHVLYSFSYLFRDAFSETGETGLSLDIEPYYYDDARKYWLGDKRIANTGGRILTNRTLLSDTSVSFAAVRAGAVVNILEGTNVGRYTVRQTQALIAGADSVYRAYTTSPSNLTGTALALNATDLEDPTQDWGDAVLDEIITISTGPNAGSYRLERVLGHNGGIIAPTVTLSGTKVRLSQSILKLDRRAPVVGGSQSYEVGVDRLGVQTPRVVIAEDVSEQFYE